MRDKHHSMLKATFEEQKVRNIGSGLGVRCGVAKVLGRVLSRKNDSNILNSEGNPEALTRMKTEKIAAAM